MSTEQKAVTPTMSGQADLGTVASMKAKWHISYLRKIARELKASARKEARGSGFEPLFDKGESFSVGINSSGQPYVQVNFTINGSTQCNNCAI